MIYTVFVSVLCVFGCRREYVKVFNKNAVPSIDSFTLSPDTKVT